jgi:hypothetical protein
MNASQESPVPPIGEERSKSEGPTGINCPVPVGETASGEKGRPPVRIPLYGIAKVSKRGYIMLLAIQGLLLAVLAVVAVIWQRRPAPPSSDRLATMLATLLPWFVAAAGIWGVLEAVIVLRRFAREEAKLSVSDPGAAPGKKRPHESSQQG